MNGIDGMFGMWNAESIWLVADDKSRAFWLLFVLLFLSLWKLYVMLVIEDAYIKASGYSETELMLEIAVLLFEQEKLSLRKSATLAGLHWLTFMKELDKRDIALHYDESLL